MKTLVLKGETPVDIERAASILRSGGTVAIPTETVYGLAANAFDPAAIAKIFAAKQRPAWDPLIVHVCDLEMLADVAGPPPRLDFESEAAWNQRAQRIMETASTLIDRFWPGPLTLLLPRSPEVPDAVTAGRPLVGVRMPRHLIALAVIQAAGVPLAAPSANRFGHTSPTTAQHVFDDLDGRIDAVVDAGPTGVGVESTVLDITQIPMVLYRPGAVTAAMIEEVCGAGSVTLYQPPETTHEPESLPSPGVGIRHYAPRARLVLVEPEAHDPEHSLLEELSRHPDAGVMLPDGWAVLPGNRAFAWGDWNDPAQLAAQLFAGLRDLDDRGVAVIVCPIPAGTGIAEAIRDRLAKAARTS